MSSLLCSVEDDGLATSEGAAAQGDQDRFLVTHSVALQKLLTIIETTITVIITIIKQIIRIKNTMAITVTMRMMIKMKTTVIIKTTLSSS